MRFLCIHAACTNAEMMKVSMTPFLKQISNDQNITFHYAQGFLDSPPPAWLIESLDGPPYLKFLQWDAALLDLGYKTQIRSNATSGTGKGSIYTADEEKDFYEYIRNHPPEPWSLGMALEYLYNIIEDEGPFDGLIGVSEGASVAATLLIEDIKACKASHTRSHFRCCIFFIGSPAWWADGTKAWLAQDHGQVIDVPTCHIVGMDDVFKKGADELLKICNADKALAINVPGGHRIPQDYETNKLIADWVREQERELLEG